MQRNANVGSKLLALIAVPAVVLVALASLGARQRLDEAADAETTKEGAELVGAANALTHELQQERLLTMRLTGGDERAADLLDDQRQETDAAAAPFGGVPASGSGAVGQRLDAVVGQIETVTTLRPSIDSGNATTEVVIDAYTEAITALVGLEAALASGGGLPELAVSLSDSVTLARAKEARALASADVARIIGVGAYRPGEYEALSTLQSEEQRQFARLEESQDGRLKTTLRNVMATDAARNGDSLLQAVLDEGVLGGSGEPGVAAGTWQETASAWLDTVHGVEGDAINGIVATADATAFEADKTARLYLIGTAAAVILSLLLASLLARRINRRLQRLTTAANRLATEELPRLVEELRSPGDAATESEPITPLPVDSGDEIGQLAEAFNAIQQVTSQVAEEQAALLRRGIADIFVNLARRNQSLLDRQIEFIDSLEAKEQDPDQLENLFRLDHLATRMRRNAESLLVLAGAEPPRRRAKPVDFADVVRVAVGEVEDFTRINLLSLDETKVGGNAAVDLAHLLSELMENATQFSPPDSTVEVVGSRSPEGGYVITISDRGIGMSAEQLSEANALLNSPPPVGLALSRSLGFIVVGRLARRLKVSVRLNASPAGGVTAVVELPATALAENPEATGLLPGPPATGPAVANDVDAPSLPDEPRPLFMGEGDVPMPPDVTMPPPGSRPAPEPLAAPVGPSSLSDALPAGEDFERGLAALVGPDGDRPDGDDDLHSSFWGEPAADAPAEDTSFWGGLGDDGVTEPGPLPEVEPSALADLAPPEPAGFEPPPAGPPDAPAPPAWDPAPTWMDGDLASVESGPSPMPEASTPPVPPAPPASPAPGLVRRQPRATLAADEDRPRAPSTRRSPEEVRAMLSRYRRGLDDGRQAGPGEE